MKNRTKFISLVLIIIAGFAVYGNSLNNEFLWDDELLIVNNGTIKDLHNIPVLFTKNITYGAAVETNYYRPLQMLTYALNYAFWKLDVRAYHLTNIALHILVAILLYWLTQLIFKNDFLSLISALLFVSHPIHTEAVTYISGRADSLAALFILFAIICYIKYAHNRDRRSFYSLSIASFLFALLSKETALILPLLLLAYDYIYKDRKKVSFKIHLPFFSLGFIYIALRKTILNFPVEKSFIDETTFFQRIPAIFKSLTMYFEKLIVPLNLHMEYKSILPPITDIRVISGIAIAFVLVSAAIMYRKKERIISFSVAWFSINYLPISSIYPLNAFFSEHWIYTSSLGLFILAGWVAVKICEKGRIFRQFSCLILAFLLVGNFYLTAKQNQYWRNPEDFYKRTLEYAPNSYRVYCGLAILYFKKGMIDKSIENLEKAVEIKPDYTLAYEYLTSGYIEKGCYDKTIGVCAEALKVDPDSDIVHENLGIAYLAKGWPNKALKEFKKTVSISPDYEQAYNNLGSTYAIIGKRKEAIASFKKAIEISPNYATAHNNLARAYYEIKRYNLAIKHCNKAIELGLKVPPEFLELLEPFR